MDRRGQRQWTDEALNEVLAALAKSTTLTEFLVFKGGRVLALLLQTPARQSYDIDAALSAPFIAQYRSREEQRQTIEFEIVRALHSHFAAMPIVRYDVSGVSVKLNPLQTHPRGWNAFAVTIKITDAKNRAVKHLPSLQMDLSAPEELGPNATSHLTEAQGGQVLAYTLERIAAEKLRAFLSSLPAHVSRVRQNATSVRAKDIYDVARIAQEHPLTEFRFWKSAGEEFRRACNSRDVACSGIDTFEENLEITMDAFDNDATIPKDVTFEQAWSTIREVVELFVRAGFIPTLRDMPEPPTT